MIDPSSGKQLATSGFCSERKVLRIRAVKWDTKAQGEVAFEKSRIVTNEVSTFLVMNPHFNPREKAWPFE
jgi:hypothetical protein